LIRFLLIPLLAGDQLRAVYLMTAIGQFYIAMRLLSEALWLPLPLRRPPVRDAVVGQAERLLQRRARPYASRPDGSLDERAVSFLVPPAESEELFRTLVAALAEHPVRVEIGHRVAEGVELVIRPAPAPAETA
jgi:hypothetical protein